MPRGAPVPSLRTIRIRQLLTQEQLAERSGVSFTTINRLENKGGAAEFTTIKKLADALGVSTADLMVQPETARETAKTRKRPHDARTSGGTAD